MHGLACGMGTLVLGSTGRAGSSNRSLPAAARDDSHRKLEAGWELTQLGPVPISLLRGGRGGGGGHIVSRHPTAMVIPWVSHRSRQIVPSSHASSGEQSLLVGSQLMRTAPESPGICPLVRYSLSWALHHWAAAQSRGHPETEARSKQPCVGETEARALAARGAWQG